MLGYWDSGERNNLRSYWFDHRHGFITSDVNNSISSSTQQSRREQMSKAESKWNWCTGG